MEQIDFHEEDKLEKVYDSHLMKRLLGYARPFIRILSVCLVLLLIAAVTDLLRPIFFRWAIDEYLNDMKMLTIDQRTQGILHIGIVFFAVMTLGFVTNSLQAIFLSKTGQQIVFNIRQHVFSHIEKLPVSYFDKNPIGRLVTRVTNDTEALNEMYTNVMVNFFKDVLLVVGSVIGMFMMSVKLTCIILLVFPIIATIAIVFRMKARNAYRDVRVKLARINAALSESISGIKIIHIFNKRQQKYREFVSISHDYYRAGMREIVVYGVFRPVVELIAAMGVAAIVWYGGIEVVNGTLTIGALFTFVTYLFQMFQPISDLSEKFNILQSAMAASERIFQVLDQPVEADEGKLVLDHEKFKGKIEFKNVWFAYNEEEWVLKDVSFAIQPGQTVALVGATGAGKTSIINLLSRLYEIQKGQVSIDGIDVKQMNKDCLRKNIATVFQDVFLFSGDVQSNIRLNNMEISDEQVEKAVEYVNAASFVEKFPGKYSQEINERGSTLSAGQRQLLAFARALVFDPAILVLDEATANIDTETELLIQDALKKITQDRTTIIIAHRLSTIQHADNIIVLHHGRIKEVGNHQELLNKKGMYYDLYSLQANAVG